MTRVVGGSWSLKVKATKKQEVNIFFSSAAVLHHARYTLPCFFLRSIHFYDLLFLFVKIELDEERKTELFWLKQWRRPKTKNDISQGLMTKIQNGRVAEPSNQEPKSKPKTRNLF